MFKYLLLKTIYSVSDIDVVERSRFDMSFKYFLEMTPEEGVITPSSLTKFRKLRLKDTDLLNLLIGKTVAIAIEKGIVRSKSIIVDATHTLSKSNPFSAVQVLKERSKILRKAIYSVDQDRKERMPKKNEDHDLQKETVENTQDNFILSTHKDAKIGHKSADSSFFGYKTHIAMTQERIITAAVVTSGEKGDGPKLPELLKISQENGIKVDTIIGDGAYSGKENL